MGQVPFAPHRWYIFEAIRHAGGIFSQALSAGLVEQFSAVFHRRSFFLTRDEFGSILDPSTFFIGSACRLTQEDAHDLMSHEVFCH
jgi:hypothetical protein